MDRKRKIVRVAVVLNCLLYILAIGIFSYGAFKIYQDPYWMDQEYESGVAYLSLLGVIILLILITVIGLILAKEWSRKLSMAINIAIIFLFLGLKIVVNYVLRNELGYPNNDMYSNIENSILLSLASLLAIISILFAFKPARQYFIK